MHLRDYLHFTRRARGESGNLGPRRWKSAHLVAAMAMTLTGIVATSPGAPVEAAPVMNLKPIVAHNPANDLATNTLSTIVITGQDLPVAPVSLLGQYTFKFAQVNNVTQGAVIGGVGGDGWVNDCYVVIGASSPTELVLGVGNLGATCIGYLVNPGDVITVTLFDLADNPIPGATVTGTAIAPLGAVPEVQAVTPPYGPMTGGNDVVITTELGSVAPEAFWFGGYQIGLGWYGTATTNITPDPVSPNSFRVVPPAFISGGTPQNYGVSVFSADAVRGLSSQNCTVLLTGCANEYLYLDNTQKSFPESGPDFNLSDLPSISASYDFPLGPASPACGLAEGQSNAAGASVGVTATIAGRARVDADVGLSYSNANIPQAIVGTGTLTVTEPITFDLTLAANISGCIEIPLPGLSIPNVVGLYVVIGGQIEGSITLQIKIAKGTYSFTGGWVPPVDGRDDTGAFGKSDPNCVDENDAPVTDSDCITTQITAGVKGTLSISPLWLQLGLNDPIDGNIGVGLSAAAVVEATVEIPPWPPAVQTGWDVCVALRWAYQIAIQSISFSGGGNLVGPYNIVGDGSLCPFGSASPPPPPVSAAKSTVTASPSEVAADGTTASTVTVTVIATDDNPVAGKTVTLASDAGTSSVISAASGPSDANGVVTFTVTDTVEETVTYTATADGVVIAQTAQVTFANVPPPPPVSAAKSTVTASPSEVAADGTTASTVTVTVIATDDNPVAGKTVTLASDAGTSSVISAASGPSDANGVVTFTVTDTVEETVTYTATADGVVIAQTAQVTFANVPPPPPVSAAKSTVTASPSEVAADGTTASTVTVTVIATDDNPVAGKTVTLASDAGTSSVISAASGPSDANGVVTFTVTDTVEETVTYTATADGVVIAQTAQVTFSERGSNPPPPVFTPSTPARILDTREGEPTIDGLFSGIGMRTAGSITELQIGGRGGVPMNATGVVLNLTVVDPQGPGYVTAFPCGSDRPTASNLNYPAGQTIANVVIAKVGVDGKVCIFTKTATHIVADVKDGFFPAGSPYGSLVPARLLETRLGWSTLDDEFNGIGLRDAGSVTELQVAGRAGVDDDAGAVVLNLTVVDPQGPGYVTAFPCGSDRPTASNLNYPAGRTIGNVAVAKVGVDGKVCIFTKTATHIVADVLGFFPDASGYGSLVPARLLETRLGWSTIDDEFNGIGLRDAESVTELQVAGRAGVVGDAGAVVLNLTVYGPQGPGYVTAFPCGIDRPTASNLNYVAGQTVGNTVIAKVGVDGKVCIFTKTATHIIADMNGYFEG